MFSELLNKLGDQIVGSKWKGRGYFRSYVIPANPKTNKQTAHRAVMQELVKRCQAVVLDDADVKAAWDNEALPLLISGYNLFVKYGRLSKISVPATGSAGSDITITYTCGIPISKAGIIRYDGSTWEIVADKGTLESGTNKTITDPSMSAGTYEYYIADLDVLVEGDTSPQEYQAVTKWEPDETNGVAKEAKCVVS
ncbi:MAG: hypothetical protein DRP50_05335 [Thermotoga sp.]|nr:MAG: hypothetical protein DRP50_05335 [Thermotoga sp.]